MKQRNDWLDLWRSLAVLTMLVFHALWDLELFGILRAGTMDTPMADAVRYLAVVKKNRKERPEETSQESGKNAYSHRQMTDEQLRAAGVPAGLVRISCGLEDAGDLVADLEQALEGI